MMILKIYTALCEQCCLDRLIHAVNIHHMLHKFVRENQIVREMRQSAFFSIIADGTIDLALIDQLSIPIRYFVGGKITERFLEYTDVTGKTTGEPKSNIFEKRIRHVKRYFQDPD